MGDKGAGSSSTALVEQPKPQSVMQYVQRIRQGETAKWEKDDLLNVIYWWRQVSGVLIGLLLGLGNVTGMMGFTMFVATSVTVTLGILRTVLGIDEEEYGGLFELLGEGMMGSFASFMVTWILAYSATQ